MMNVATQIPLIETGLQAVPSAEGEGKFALYIGKKVTAIHETMLEASYAGIAADNLFSARHTLMRLFQSHSLAPEVIICDARTQGMELKSFLTFIQSHAEFRNIPFLLLVGEKDIATFDRQSLLSGVDDVIYYNSSAADIRHKINFIKKFKQLKYTDRMKPGKKEYFQELSLNYMIKRTFDIFVSALILIILSPLLLLIALAIKLDSKGPVFYAALRAGCGYKVFKFYKFRTMVVDADKKLHQVSHLNLYNDGKQGNGPLFIKVKNDPRITRLGAFLRNTSLDELPQLLNVLKGDMSLVGNRPLPLYEAATLTKDEWVERFLAPAGITGLWQVNKRGKKEMSVEERINLDITYAHKNSFLYDMRIMMNTPLALVQKENV